MGLIDEQKALIQIDYQLKDIIDLMYENPPNILYIGMKIGKLKNFVESFLKAQNIKLKDNE